MAVVKERFGEFAVAPAGGDTVQVDRGVARRVDRRPPTSRSWARPAVTAWSCPTSGRPSTRSSDRVLPRGLDRADFQLAGGCYNPRFNRGADPGYSLSRHSWGIAVDFNPSTNPLRGVSRRCHSRSSRYSGRWGFSWGGSWTVPDGMHFEWYSLPSVYAAGCSDVTAVLGSVRRTRRRGAPMTSPRGCLAVRRGDLSMSRSGRRIRH